VASTSCDSRHAHLDLVDDHRLVGKVDDWFRDCQSQRPKPCSVPVEHPHKQFERERMNLVDTQTTRCSMHQLFLHVCNLLLYLNLTLQRESGPSWGGLSSLVGYPLFLKTRYEAAKDTPKLDGRIIKQTFGDN
jgi:hypothetical protein